MGNRENLKSFLFLIVILSFSLTHFAGVRSWEQLIMTAEDSLSEGREKEAEYYFYAARDFALKQGNWAGVTRAGYGLAVLGNSKEAIQSWSIARDIAWKQASWEGLFKAGQGFASLGNFKETYEAISIARDIAWKQASWEGLFKAGQGFAQINAQHEAKRLYKEAELIAEKQGRDATNSLGKRIKFFTDTLLIQTIKGLMPGLAVSWEITADGKIAVMHLRKGVNCFNGNKFNANSVVTTFRGNQNKWEMLGLQSVERVDEYKVRISLKHFRFLVNLTDPETSIQGP